MSRRDRELLESLRVGLRVDREPPEKRVLEVRRTAERMREDARLRVPRTPPAPMSRRGFLATGAAASAGAALGVGAYAILDHDSVPPTPPTEPIEVQALVSGADAQAELVNHTWGVEYRLTVSGLPAGRSYDVVYRTADGGELPVGSFIGADDPVVCNMTGASLRADTRAIEVRATDGSPLLRSRLT